MKWKPAKLYSSLEPHVYGENGQLLAMKKGGATYFYHYNAHGDVIALTDAQGNVVARYEYDTWGQIRSQTGALADENPYRYAGYQYGEETGLYYLMARYYHPTHGVFLSMDPDPGDADDILTQNGYTYANNNPVMKIDPDGHFFWFVVNAGFAAYDGYKAFKKGGWKAAAIAVGVGLVGGAAFKGAKIAYRVYKARRALNFAKVTRKAIAGKITGYTKHGLAQAMQRDGGRGVAPKAILDAIRNPKKVVQQSGGRTKYVGKNAVVVLNKNGKIITTYAKGSKGIRRK